MVRASIVVMSTQAQRQQHRRQLGTLQSNILKKITLTRYATHLNRFCDFLRTFTSTWPVDPDEYDSYLTEYLELLWDTGEPKTMAAYTLAAVHHYSPTLKRKLPRAWRLKNIWDRLELPCQAIPLSQEHMFGVACWFFRRNQNEMGAACIIGFAGLLRTGELLRLRVGDVVDTPNGIVLHLGETKTAKRKMMIDETVIISDALACILLQRLCRGKPPGDYLIGMSPQRFRTAWNHMRKALDFANHKVLPYSLRRGGATWYFQQTGSFSKTLVKGRWEHVKTCKLYLNQAQLALNQNTLPAQSLTRLQQLEQLLRPHLYKWVRLGRVEAWRRPREAKG